jgi:hypothetical protein
MGNYVGSIYFDEGTIDINKLNELRKKHVLTPADPNSMTLIEGKKSYGVEIAGGQTLLWSFSGGPEKAIKAFLDEAKSIFGDAITTSYKFLPM